MNEPSPIVILMATYNGCKYLEEQIRSLQTQTCEDWCLYISDDGSTDHTSVLLQQAAAGDRRIVVLEDPVRHRGAAGRFCWLLEQTRQRHQIFFFCDQDDVWLPDKMKTMVRILEQGDVAVPTLVHCDLVVVDQSLQMIKPSLYGHLELRFPHDRPDQLALLNSVTGCACAFNRALADIALPMITEDSCVIHDWWLALVASQCGRIITLPEAMVLYRQHSNNVLGMGKIGKRRWSKLSRAFLMERFSAEDSKGRMTVFFYETLRRMAFLHERYGKHEKMSRSLALLSRGRRGDLIEFMIRYRVLSQSPLSSLILLSDVLRSTGKTARTLDF